MVFRSLTNFASSLTIFINTSYMKKIYALLGAVCLCASAANAVTPMTDGPAEEKKLYLIGDPAGGWNPTKGLEMTADANGNFTVTCFIAADKYFGFADALGDNDGDWGTLNSHRYGATEGNKVISLTEDNQMLYPSENSWKTDAVGYYTFTVNPTDRKFTVAEADEAMNWSIVGAFNGWGDDAADIAMTAVEGEKYVYTAVVEELDGEFKFRLDNAWISSYGAGDAVDVKEAGEYASYFNGQNFKAEGLKNMRLTLDLKNNKLTVAEEVVVPPTPETPDAPTGLTADVTTLSEEGKVVLTWDAVEGAVSYDVAYKLADAEEWTNENTLEATITLSELQAGASYTWKVLANCADDVKTEYSEEATFTVPANVGVAAVGVEASEAVCFDLQGRRVANPERGIYIINGQKVAK